MNTSSTDAIDALRYATSNFISALGVDSNYSSPQETESESEPEVEEIPANFENFHSVSHRGSHAVGDSIPVNTTTTQVQTTARFSSAIWFNKIQEQKITLAGVGGIGSYVAFLLSRMQPRLINLYDPDIVEAVNMSGQLYSNNDVNRYKVTALRRTMEAFSNFYNVGTYEERFTSASSTTDIMICGFDNMEARKVFFEAWLNRISNYTEEERSKCLFIDGRLNAEEFQVLCITGNNQYAIDKYTNDWLFSDDEVEETVCSYKQTTYMANMIGSVIVNLFTNFCANLCNPLIERDIPFLTRYDGLTMFFKTE